MIRFFEYLLEFLIYFFLLALMWIGAEYVFEGGVHSSPVDAVVCAVVARLLVEGDDYDEDV